MFHIVLIYHAVVFNLLLDTQVYFCTIITDMYAYAYTELSCSTMKPDSTYVLNKISFCKVIGDQLL